MRRFFGIFVCLLIPLAAVLAYSPDVPAMISLNRTSYMGVGGIANNPHKDLADTAGIQWARQGVWWYHVQPDSEALANGTYAWSGYDNAFSNLNDRTYPFEIMPVFAGTPKDAADPNCPTYNTPKYHLCPPAPEYWDEWTEFVRKFADRYSYIDHYEVWNEAFSEEWHPNPDSISRIFFQGTPSQLARLTDSVAAAINSEDKVIGWGNPGSPGPHGSTTGEVLDLTDNSVDIVSGHCYGSGSACVGKYELWRDTLVAYGYSSMDIWSTEGYHTANPFGYYSDSTSAPPFHPTDAENRAYISQLVSLSTNTSWFDKVFLFRWALTPPEWHEHPTAPVDSQWHVHGYNYLVVQQDLNKNLLGVREQSYCQLVSQAGNEGQEDRCPDVFDIGGHHFTTQTVPPNTTCNFTEATTSGSTPYSWDWYVDGIYQDSGDNFSYNTPSSGSFDVRVVATDTNGAEDEYTETMTVDSEAICQSR